VQWAALALAAALCMNIQVATRFLSACPPLYWAIAEAVGTRGTGARAAPWLPRAAAAAVAAWCAGYTIVGTLMFARYLPWT
jgi:phosphatidylinositol glycan class V